MTDTSTPRSAVLPYDINGFVYLNRNGGHGPELLYIDVSDYLPVLKNMGMTEEVRESLLNMHLEETGFQVNLSRIQIDSGVPDYILRLSLQDATTMVGDGRIKDLLTECALLQADRFKKIELQIGVLFQERKSPHNFQRNSETEMLKKRIWQSFAAGLKTRELLTLH